MQKAVLGYDASKEAVVTGKLPMQPEVGDGIRLELIPLTKGPHRLGGKRQAYYEAVRNFLQHRKWRKAPEHATVAGTSWTELLVLFDTGGYRTQADRIKHDEAALSRAEARDRRRVRLNRTLLARTSY